VQDLLRHLQRLEMCLADVSTYDLLHNAIYVHNSRESAVAFLLAVWVRGYHPRVVAAGLPRSQLTVQRIGP